MLLNDGYLVAERKEPAKLLYLPQYMPQLDTLRFFAVFLVLLEHWIPWLGNTYFFLGSTGVIFFFVLSGYLITGILLRSKTKAELQKSNKIRVIRQFFIRRSLRIFPIYYLVIILVVVFSSVFGDDVRKAAGWYLLYLNNFKIYFSQHWGNIGHTWSLAVEEQFYLFWPWVILFTPSRHVRKAIILFIVIGFCSREVYYFLTSDPNSKAVYGTILTPLCFDAFGLGALLAYSQSVGTVSSEKLILWTTRLLIAGLTVWVCIIYSKNDLVFFLTSNGMVAFLSACLVARASYGFTGLWQKILELPGLRYLGKISYGIYLYHYIVPAFYASLPKSVFPLSASNALNFCIYFFITVLLATVSWHIIEKPLNNMKKHFKYLSSDGEKIPTGI